jgi:hypothetical protein
MNGYTFQELRRALEHCNDRKGYGKVTEIKRFADGRLEVTIARPYMKDTVRQGRMAGNRVRFAGTSAKIRVLQHPDYN